MRQLASISAIISLLLSGYAPMRVTACHQMTKTAICHRAIAIHHCDMPMDDDEETASATVPQSSLSSAPAKCPMQCCTTGRLSVITIVPARTHVASLHVLAEKIYFAVIPANCNFPRSPLGRGPPSI